MRRKVWLGMVLLGASTPAAAHIDPAPLLLEKAAAARAEREIRTLVIEGDLFEPGSPPVPVWEGIVTGRAHRRELQRSSGREAILTIDRRRWRIDADGPGAPTRIRPDPWQVFLVEGDRDPYGRRGMALLDAYDIDPSVLSMTRQQGRPCFVIGARPEEPDVPQLWLDHELMTPARLVFDDDGTRHELRWLGFDGPLTTPFYPSVYEERRDGEIVLRIEYDRASPNASIDERRFQAPD